MKIFNYLLITICFTAVAACEMFLEEPIDEEQVTINAPRDGYQSGNSRQTFWWEEIEEALHYRLQIVQPSFDNAQQLVLDSTVNSHKFNYSLEPGEYEWRVRAENGSSETSFTDPYGLVIDSTQNLEEQQLILIEPGSGKTFSDTIVAFSWEELLNATKYRIQIKKDAPFDESGGREVLDSTIKTTELEYSFSATKDPATYYWWVRGENATEQTPFSPYRSLKIDTSAN